MNDDWARGGGFCFKQRSRSSALIIIIDDPRQSVGAPSFADGGLMNVLKRTKLIESRLMAADTLPLMGPFAVAATAKLGDECAVI